MLIFNKYNIKKYTTPQLPKLPDHFGITNDGDGDEKKYETWGWGKGGVRGVEKILVLIGTKKRFRWKTGVRNF